MAAASRLETVVVATDHSTAAHRAVTRAAMLAAAAGARLVVLHVLGRGAFDELRRRLGGNAAADALYAEAEATTSSLAAQVAAAHSIRVEARVVVDRVAAAIVACADAVDSDLVVVGTQGAGHLRRPGIGATAERLLRLSTRPLLLVRQHVHAAYRRVLVPVDFSPWSLPALGLAQAVAPDAHLLLLHAWSVPWEGKLEVAGVDRATIDRCRQAATFEAARALEGLAAEAALPASAWSSVLVHGEPREAILDQEEQTDADLIVIGKHGRDVLRELLLGSTTRNVLAEATEDVLVAQATATVDPD